MILSKHFTRQEYIYHPIAMELGIENRFPLSARLVVKHLFGDIIEPLQEALFEMDKDLKIHIIQGYICPELDGVISGVVNGQHVASNSNGAAVDIKVHGMAPLELLKIILDEQLDFDKLVWEFPNSVHNGWIHISTAGLNQIFRDQILIREHKKPVRIVSKEEIYKYR